MADENKMRGSFRPMSSMIAEGVSGSPADPGLMIHEMKVAARKAAEGPTPPEPEPEPKQPKVKAGTYEGAGGYAYEVMDNGAIKIVKAPKGRGLGVKLTKGMAFDAIMDELKDAEPVDSVFAEERAIFDDMLKSKERRESAMADVAGGVVPGEGRSGMAAAAEPETSRKMAKK